ncbi:hypothetical protein, partial [Serratia marcescens]|uniref:hypothetical protein n=1 Tax=Serratia marcescens TaxID=615 RepID=UPI0013D9E154
KTTCSIALAMGSVLKALSKSGHKVTVLPVSEVTEDKKSLKLDERIFKADLVAFSARPFGLE